MYSSSSYSSTSLRSAAIQRRLDYRRNRVFSLSRLVGLLGFFLLTAAIGFGVYSQVVMPRGLQIAYVAAAAGILTEFISGVFFYLYTSTLKQINLFHSELQLSRRVSTGLLLAGLVHDQCSREAIKAELAARLIHGREDQIAGTQPAAKDKTRPSPPPDTGGTRPSRRA
jgi:hypothetical protein